MNDKRNSDLFANDALDSASLAGNWRGPKSYHLSNQSLNSIMSSVSSATNPAHHPKSSVIICHFDFVKFDLNLDANSLVGRREKVESSKPSTNGVGMVPKSAIKSSSSSSSSRLVRQHSSSSAMQAPVLGTRPALLRYESCRSDDTVSVGSFLLPSPRKLPPGSVLNLSKATAPESATSAANRIRTLLVKYKKLKKSDISSPLNFNHVTHLDKPVPIGKRYKVDYC